MKTNYFKQLNWGWIVANTLPLYIGLPAMYFLSAFQSWWAWIICLTLLIGLGITIGQTIYFGWQAGNIRFTASWFAITLIGFYTGFSISVPIAAVIGILYFLLTSFPLQLFGLSSIWDLVNVNLLLFSVFILPPPYLAGFGAGGFMGFWQSNIFDKHHIQSDWQRWSRYNAQAGGVASVLCFLAIFFSLPYTAESPLVFHLFLPLILGLPVALFTQDAARIIREQLVAQVGPEHSDNSDKSS